MLNLKTTSLFHNIYLHDSSRYPHCTCLCNIMSFGNQQLPQSHIIHISAFECRVTEETDIWMRIFCRCEQTLVWNCCSIRCTTFLLHLVRDFKYHVHALATRFAPLKGPRFPINKQRRMEIKVYYRASIKRRALMRSHYKRTALHKCLLHYVN